MSVTAHQFTLTGADLRNWRTEGPVLCVLSLLSDQEKALTAAHAVLSVAVTEAKGRRVSVGHQRWKRQVIWADP